MKKLFRGWRIVLALAVICFVSLSLSCFVEANIGKEHLRGKVVDIELKSEETFLVPTYRYIVVTFDTGDVRAFNDFYLNDFIIGKEYNLIIFQTALSRPVWVIESGLE